MSVLKTDMTELMISFTKSSSFDIFLLKADDKIFYDKQKNIFEP